MNNKTIIPKTETSSELCQTSKLELFANIQGMSNIYLKVITEKNNRSRYFEAMLNILEISRGKKYRISTGL